MYPFNIKLRWLLMSFCLAPFTCLATDVSYCPTTANLPNGTECSTTAAIIFNDAQSLGLGIVGLPKKSIPPSCKCCESGAASMSSGNGKWKCATAVQSPG